MKYPHEISKSISVDIFLTVTYHFSSIGLTSVCSKNITNSKKWEQGKNTKGHCTANGKIIVIKGNLSLTSVTGGLKFRICSQLVKEFVIICSRQLLFSYQFAGMGQENKKNVAKLMLNGKPG